jgi:hypothetical protein
VKRTGCLQFSQWQTFVVFGCFSYLDVLLESVWLAGLTAVHQVQPQSWQEIETLGASLLKQFNATANAPGGHRGANTAVSYGRLSAEDVVSVRRKAATRRTLPSRWIPTCSCD